VYYFKNRSAQVTVADEGALKAYLEHPQHVELGEI